MGSRSRCKFLWKFLEPKSYTIFFGRRPSLCPLDRHYKADQPLDQHVKADQPLDGHYKADRPLDQHVKADLPLDRHQKTDQLLSMHAAPPHLFSIYTGARGERLRMPPPLVVSPCPTSFLHFASLCLNNRSFVSCFLLPSSLVQKTTQPSRVHLGKGLLFAPYLVFHIHPYKKTLVELRRNLHTDKSVPFIHVMHWAKICAWVQRIHLHSLPRTWFVRVLPAPD
jgi:hypothetical protein